MITEYHTTLEVFIFLEQHAMVCFIPCITYEHIIFAFNN